MRRNNLTFKIKIVSQKKKRKIPVSEKKRLAKERGLKSTEKRGKRLRSRKKFTSLPANWRETVVQCGSKKKTNKTVPVHESGQDSLQDPVGSQKSP